MLRGIAHTAVCVPDVDAATAWYATVLGLRVLSPPYRMEGDAIERDMGELVPSPVVVKAAILGFDDSDRVLELIEYPNAPSARSAGSAPITETGLTHVGLLCDDIDAARAHLEASGVELLTAGIADVAGVRTTWFRDPWGVTFILVEKRRADRPYWRQHSFRVPRADRTTTPVAVRDAVAADVPAILAIYNEVLVSSAAIWRDEPETLAERETWFDGKQAEGWPVLVAVNEGAVVGFTALGPFRAWPGYAPTVEHSIHVADGHRGAGAGRELLEAVMERARAMGKHVIVAGVDGANEASIRFHQRLGFVEVARMPAIGVKFGEPVDLVLLQRGL